VEFKGDACAGLRVSRCGLRVQKKRMANQRMTSLGSLLNLQLGPSVRRSFLLFDLR